MSKRYNILICPLEWGLGHAARMIPVAATLKDMGHNVIIASGREHSALFRNELSGLSYIEFTGFRPDYSRFLPQYLSMLLKIPSLIIHVISEHNRLKKIIKDNDIDLVISDNRFGLWNKKTTSVYVTHMPRIPFPFPVRFLEPVGIAIHRTIIRKYNYCWIPDLPGDVNLSGRLSHSVRHTPNTRFIGLLSRFSSTGTRESNNEEEPLHNTVILSGPEPQRGMLKQILISILDDNPVPSFILEGKPLKGSQRIKAGNVHLCSHLPAPDMARVIRGSKSIITRSGYTTIMELVSLGTRALLIPTPGQTEQEYLAGYLSEKGWFDTVGQGKMNALVKLPDISAQWPSGICETSRVLLKTAVDELLVNLHEKHQTAKSGQKPGPDLPG